MIGTANPPMTPKLRTNMDSKGYKLFANGSGDGRVFGSIAELMGTENAGGDVSSYFSMGWQDGNTSRETIYMDGKAGSISCKRLSVDGKDIAPTAITLTVESNRLKNLSYTAKYYPVLGMVFVRIYGVVNAALNPGYDYNLLKIGSNTPAAGSALAVKCAKDCCAIAKSDGYIAVRPLESGMNSYDLYINGFWFV